jgi:deoxyadenosine/deoxycytidine kinase
MPLIAFSGLPGAGKTTIARLLAEQIDAAAFLEPEECDWPETVQNRYAGSEEITFFWFRSIRGNNLYLADRARKESLWAIVDTMYEHIRTRYLRHYGISRLGEYHPFQDVFEIVAERDWDTLICPDFCFFLSVDEIAWRQRLQQRSRISDRVLKIGDRYYMQDIMEEATAEYCRNKRVPYTVLVNETGSEQMVVERILRAIASQRGLHDGAP